MINLKPVTATAVYTWTVDVDPFLSALFQPSILVLSLLIPIFVCHLYPRTDSNCYCLDFESSVSFRWTTRAHTSDGIRTHTPKDLVLSQARLPFRHAGLDLSVPQIEYLQILLPKLPLTFPDCHPFRLVCDPDAAAPSFLFDSLLERELFPLAIVPDHLDLSVFLAVGYRDHLDGNLHCLHASARPSFRERFLWNAVLGRSNLHMWQRFVALFGSIGRIRKRPGQDSNLGILGLESSAVAAEPPSQIASPGVEPGLTV